jgi:hypothetical protein
MGPNRRQKPKSDAAASAANSARSEPEKYWGSAKFGRNAVIIESKESHNGLALPVA